MLIRAIVSVFAMSVAALAGFCLRASEPIPANPAKPHTQAALIISVPPRAEALIQSASAVCGEIGLLARGAGRRLEVHARQFPADLHTLPGRFTAFWTSIPSLPATRSSATPVIVGFVILILLMQGGAGTRR